MIKKIFVVNQLGHEMFEIGQTVAGEEVVKIEISQLYFTGDPYDHYCGFGATGKMLFSLNPSLPLHVEYI